MSTLLFKTSRTAIALLASTSLANAQTRLTLENYNNTNITANGRGLITGPIINNMNNQIINGMGVLGDTNVWTGTNVFSGPTVLPSAGVVSILASGAKCNAYSNSPTDDSNALRTWLSTLPPGTIVVFPPGTASAPLSGTFCLHNSDLTLPPGVKFVSVGMPIGGVNQGGNPQGGGFVHPGTARLIGSFSDVFDHIGIWRSLDGCFHITPTLNQSNQDVLCWYNEWSEGLTLPQVTGAPTSHGVEIISSFIEGFHWGLFNQSAQLKIDGLKGDNTVCLSNFSAGDANIENNIRCEPYYSGKIPNTTGAWQRYGACDYSNSGGGYYVSVWQCEGWPIGHVLESVGALNMSGLQYEYAGTAFSLPGFPAEQFGVGVRAIGQFGGNNTIDHVVSNSDNFDPTTSAVMTDAIVIDANSSKTVWSNVFPDYVPAGGTGFYASGQTAVPITELITALPQPGGSVSLTISGALAASVGGPFTMTYSPVRSDDTPASVAFALDALCNTNHSEMAHVHIVCLTGPYFLTPGEFGVYVPSDQASNITVSVTGATVTTGTGNAIASSTGVLNNYDMSIATGLKANGATPISSTNTGGTPGACTLTLSGGTFTTAATFTGNVSASGAIDASGLTVANPGSYTGAPGFNNVAATGCGFPGITVNVSWNTLGNNIVLGNSASGVNAWQIDGVYSANTEFPLPANWLAFSQTPARLYANNISWSPVFTSNLAGSGGGATIGANSFDNVGTMTIPGGQTATLYFATPYPLLENCPVPGGPMTATVAPKFLSITNQGNVSATFPYSCSMQGHL